MGERTTRANLIDWGAAALLACGAAVPGCYDGAESTAGSATDSEGFDASGGVDTTATDPESEDSSGTTGDAVPEDLDPGAVPEPLAARLSDTQYRNTVLDVLGQSLTEEEVELLPRDVPIEGTYSTSARAQGFNAQYVLGYAFIARSVTDRLDPNALTQDFGECDGVDEACLVAFIGGLGRRMFRRPLTADEQQRYVELAAAIGDGPENDDADIVRGIAAAMMQAPSFLYRLERETDGNAGEARRLDGYELASRLSYFLWQSTPDEQLLDFAAGPSGDGQFDSAAIDGEIERMILDPKFARARSLFWGEYSLASTSAFGATDPALAADLQTSLLATLERISGVDAEAAPLSAIFSGTEVVMTPSVAEIAGAESLGEGLQVYDTTLAEERIGVVTHPAFLAAMGTTSFVGRGVFMTDRLLCQHTAAPPDNIADQIMDTAQQTEGLTPRGASEFRFGLSPVCQTCHFQFEPIAYAFERYDMAGRYVLTDDDGRDLFSDGVLPATGDRPEIAFADATELLTELGELEAVHACFVENMSAFGTGAPALWEGEFLDDAVTSFTDEGLTFEALVRSIATGDQLIYSRIVAP